MTGVWTETWPYVVLIMVGFLPNEIWRVLGLVLARGLDEESEMVVAARAIATALITGVVAKLIVFSTGALGALPFELRLGAAVAGFIVFLVARRSVFAGVAAGEAMLLLGGFLLGR